MPKIMMSREKNRFAAPWTLYVGDVDGERSAPLPRDRYDFAPDVPVELSDAEARFFLDAANVGKRIFEKVKDAPAPSTTGNPALGNSPSGPARSDATADAKK